MCAAPRTNFAQKRVSHPMSTAFNFQILLALFAVFSCSYAFYKQFGNSSNELKIQYYCKQRQFIFIGTVGNILKYK